MWPELCSVGALGPWKELKTKWNHQLILNRTTCSQTAWVEMCSLACEQEGCRYRHSRLHVKVCHGGILLFFDFTSVVTIWGLWHKRSPLLDRMEACNFIRYGYHVALDKEVYDVRRPCVTIPRIRSSLLWLLGPTTIAIHANVTTIDNL